MNHAFASLINKLNCIDKSFEENDREVDLTKHWVTSFHFHLTQTPQPTFYMIIMMF